MYFFNSSLISLLLVKKLLKAGKQHKSISLNKQLLLLAERNNILLRALLKLMVPVTFKTTKIGHIKYQIPILTHYYRSIKLAIYWLFKAAKVKSFNKMPFVKAVYLECHDVIKKQGIAYTYKQQYIKKTLANRIFIHLLTIKKIK